MTPKIDADRVSHRDDFYSDPISNLRDVKIPRNDGDDLPAVALHLLQRRCRHFVHVALCSDVFLHSIGGRYPMERVLAAVRVGPSTTEIRDFPMPDITEDSALLKMEV